MGRVLMWLFGVPVTVAVLFAVFGPQSTASVVHDNVTIAAPGSNP